MFLRSLRMLTISTLIAIPAALGTFGSGASAAVGCRDAGCSGKSPVSMRCERDAVSLNFVVFEDHASGGTFGRQVVTLRYSPRCRASWSRVTASAEELRRSRKMLPLSTDTPQARSAQPTVPDRSIRRCDQEKPGRVARPISTVTPSLKPIA
jgi:Protein of unknown function (DUF2690)